MFGVPGKGGVENQHFRQLFIGGLPSSVDKELLEQYFGKYGQVVDAYVSYDKETKQFRGFGFVTFRSCDCVDKVQAARPHKLCGRFVDTKRVLPRDVQKNPITYMRIHKLFVDHLNKSTKEADLRDYFQAFGEIRSIEIVKDTGSAFITFFDSDAVDKAVLYQPHRILCSYCECSKALVASPIQRERVEENRPPRDPEYLSKMKNSSCQKIPLQGVVNIRDEVKNPSTLDREQSIGELHSDPSVHPEEAVDPADGLDLWEQMNALALEASDSIDTDDQDFQFEDFTVDYNPPEEDLSSDSYGTSYTLNHDLEEADPPYYSTEAGYYFYDPFEDDQNYSFYNPDKFWAAMNEVDYTGSEL